MVVDAGAALNVDSRVVAVVVDGVDGVGGCHDPHVVAVVSYAAIAEGPAGTQAGALEVVVWVVADAPTGEAKWMCGGL